MIFAKRFFVALTVATLALASAAPLARAQVCTTSSQCGTPDAGTAKRPICDFPGTGMCRSCTNGAECIARNAGTTICNTSDAGGHGGECVGCIASTQCSGPTPICDLGTATCVGCLGSGDCNGGSGGNPVCDQSSHQCVSCRNDFEPTNPGILSCSNPKLPACQKTAESGQTGACTECSSTNQGLCSDGDHANTPRCIVSKGKCGCTVATEAMDCGSVGRICDPSLNGGAGQCIFGCRGTDGGMGNCDRDEKCLYPADGGAFGTCVSPSCGSDADCAGNPIKKKCDTTAHRCVECLSDANCKDGQVCATDSSDPHYEKCVDCTPTKAGKCTDPARCLGSDKCGCTIDGDCGGAKSGRVCDDTGTHTCIDGCRGTGGNLCADDKTCSSTDHSIGMCNPNDGGAGDGGGGLDGGSGVDGGPENFDGVVEGGGCKCSAVGAAGSGLGLGLGLSVMLGVAALGRRRSRRK